MILVDTNVWSELLKPDGHALILDWLRQNDQSLVLSSIVLGELEFFVEKQDDGRRKSTMRNVLSAVVAGRNTRLIGFDEPEAEAYGSLMAQMRRAGTSLPLIDGWIAAQAIANQLSIATRNVSDFARTGVDLIDPWET